MTTLGLIALEVSRVFQSDQGQILYSERSVVE